MEKNRKRTGLIVGISVIVLLVCAAVVAGIVVLGSPKVMLARGIENLQKELNSEENPVLKELGFSQMMEQRLENPSSTSMELTVTLPQVEDWNRFDITLSQNLDSANKKQSIDFAFGMYHFDVIEGNVAVQDNTVYVSMPKLLEDTYMVKLDQFGKDFNASIWSEYLGMELDETLSIDLFEEEEEQKAGKEELEAAIQEQITALKDDVILTKTEGKKELERAGKTVKTSGVRVTIDKTALHACMDEIYKLIQESDFYQEEHDELFAVRFAEDVVLDFYIDNQGRILQMEAPNDFVFENSEVTNMSFIMDFKGSERTLDEIEIACSLTDETETVDMLVSSVSKWDYDNKEWEGSLSYRVDDTEYLVEAEGGLKDIVSGESFTMDIGTISFLEDGEPLVRIAGEITIANTAEEIEIPTSAVDILNMNEIEVTGLLQELLKSLQGALYF